MCDRRRLEDMPDFLLIWPETAKILRMGRNAAYAAAHRGDFATVRIGRKLLVPKASLIKLLSGQNDDEQHS